MSPDNPAGPLDGLLILDLTQFAAGPYCTMLLADAGARVIKIEPPGRGEPYRHEGEPLLVDGEQVGSYFLRHNRNKESVTIDLASPGGKEVFEGLVEVADVVVENFKADSMLRMGLGYERLRKLNAKLVYASISGFGHPEVSESPNWNWPAFAVVAEAMGGIMDRLGDHDCEPHWSGVSLGDLYASLLAYCGILTAIYEVGRTGEGDHVDISMCDGMISLNERAIFVREMTGRVAQRGADSDLAPFGAFRALDGYLAIGVIGDNVWRRFCQAIDREDLLNDPRLRSGRLRATNLELVLRPAIELWLAQLTRDQAVQALVASNVPAGPVLDAGEVADSAHTVSRQMIVEIDLPGYGPYRSVRSPIRLANHPDPRKTPPPRLGEHTDLILSELLHLSANDIQMLRHANAI